MKSMLQMLILSLIGLAVLSVAFGRDEIVHKAEVVRWHQQAPLMFHH